MLDSATIVAFGSSNSTSVRSGGSPFIPMFLGKVYVYAPIPDKAYVHTRIHVWNTEMCRCSQVIVDEHQRPCVVIEDIVSKRVPDNSFTTDTERNVENNAESIDVVDQSTEPTIANISEPAVNVSETTLSEEGLLGFLGNIMKIDLAQGDLDTPFLSLGMDSASLVEMTSRVEANIEGQLYPTIFFEYPTPREFLAFLIEEYASSLPTSQIDEPAVQEEITAPPLVSLPTPPSPHYEPIAVIGMAGRYPQANNLDAFWENLCNGTDCVTDIPEQRWDWRNYFNENVGTPGKTYSRWGAFLDNVGHFDPSFFGIAPSEAANHDPQARLFHTVAWETLEHAGYGARHSTPKNTGVWVGYSHDHYYEQRIKGEEHQLRGLGLETSVANQFSYFMDWHGPSLVVNTLCSSSLVAVHQAAHSLQRGECEMALVGGVHAALSPEYYISMSHQRALSPSGRCRTFDISADGYVPGEGVGAVLLKPLNKALEDGDRVWGVIKGSANNHGGRASRATAPNPAAQTDVIRKAMQLANVKSEEISYVETHGTGTKIGDPLEIGALKKAFGNVSQGENKCRLGSLKSAIGHLESAAGIAGLHKLLLSLNHGVLPPTCHVRETNPALELDGSGFVLNNQLSQWQTQGKRIAGLSAFGLLGVNAHLIIEEAPAQPLPPQGNTKTFHTLTVSARNETGLQKLVERYVKLDNISSEVLPHFCFTANTGRTHFDYRVAAAGTSWNEIKQRLVLWLNGSKSSNEPMLCAGKKPRKQTGIAFMFTGQGAQYSGMAKALYESQPRFRLALDKCVQAFGPHMDTPLLPIIFETNGTQAINDTRYSQPALFSIEYALATLWMHWGIAPKALIGHSIGEYVAACIAGVMSLEDSARLVAARGRLMQSTGGKIGAMVAVLSAPEHFQDELKQHSKLNIAALNSPENTVISGCREQMQVFTQMLRNKDVKFTPLKVSHAFHSTLMDPIKHQFLDVARSIVYQKPNMPMISNVTGELLAKAPDADYWWRHLLGTVRFSQGIQTLNTMDISVYLELGPNAVLSGLAAKTLNSSSVVALPSLRLGVDDEQAVCQHIMQLYAHGIPIDWNGFYSDCVCIRQPLPSYPFDEKNYWIESRVNASEPIRHNHSIVTETENTFSVAHPLLGDVVVTENPSNLHRTDGELPQFQQNTMHKEI
jgi:acyl transferase domain-containing protein